MNRGQARPGKVMQADAGGNIRVKTAIDAKQGQRLAVLAECSANIQIRNGGYLRHAIHALRHRVRARGGGHRNWLRNIRVRIQLEDVIRRSGENLSALLPDSGKLHDSRHVGDGDDLRILQEHVQKSAGHNGSAGVGKAGRIVVLSDKQPFGKGQMRLLFTTGSTVNLALRLMQPFLQLHRYGEGGRGYKLRRWILELHFSGAHHKVGGEIVEGSRRVSKLDGVPALEPIRVGASGNQPRPGIDGMNRLAEIGGAGGQLIARWIAKIPLAP